MEIKKIVFVNDPQVVEVIQNWLGKDYLVVLTPTMKCLLEVYEV